MISPPSQARAAEESPAVLPYRGSCYGYAIRSSLDFHYLRSGSGPSLEIVPGELEGRPSGERLRSWAPPDFPARVELYQEADGYRLWNEEAGWFGIEPARGRITVPPTGDPVRREERIWGLPLLLTFLARGDLALHASSVEVNGKALVLAAPRRFGKTTLAAGFAAAGYRVLAEDLTCIRPTSDPAVIPGPAMLRVRRDMVDHLRIAGADEIGRDEDRAHFSLVNGRGSSDPVPLGAIALLLEGETDPVVTPAPGADVIRDLWILSFKLPTDSDMQRCFDQVGRVAATTRIVQLHRRLTIPDLRPTVDRLVEALAEPDPS